MKELVIFGHTPGDSSVGISGCKFTLETGLDDTKDNRESVKGVIRWLARFIHEIHDNGAVQMYFEDCKQELDGGQYSIYRYSFEMAKEDCEWDARRKLLTDL